MGAQRADVIAEPNLLVAERNIIRWFNTNVFRQPASYTFGNRGIRLVRAPGLVNMNASLILNFRFWENKSLQFRGEMLPRPIIRTSVSPAKSYLWSSRVRVQFVPAP